MQFNGLHDLKLKDNVSLRVRYLLGLPAIVTRFLVLVLQWKVLFQSVFGLKSCQPDAFWGCFWYYNAHSTKNLQSLFPAYQNVVHAIVALLIKLPW
jgi:hypothetical protein